MKKLMSVTLLLPLLLCSCTHYYYVPNIQNVPLFREKNEVRISGSYAGGDESGCLEIQGALAVSDKIGIMTDFMSAKSEGDHSLHDWGRGTYLDAAAGYFKPINKYGVFEIYGGYGTSWQDHNYETTKYNSGGSFTSVSSGTAELKSGKVFIQPAIGFSFNIFDVALSTRFCRLSFYKVDNQISRAEDPDEYIELYNLEQKKVYHFLEPALTLRAGWKNLKIQVQGSIDSYHNNLDYPFESYHLSIGLQYAFAERFKNNP